MNTEDTQVAEAPRVAEKTEIPTRSYLYQLVAAGYDSTDNTAAMQYILEQRKQDPPAPYYDIARHLSVESGHKVTHETCRRWVKTTTGQDA